MRDQFLNERIEYYKDLEDAIANAAAGDGLAMCTREHVKAGMLHLDPDMADHVVSLHYSTASLEQEGVLVTSCAHATTRRRSKKRL